MSLHYSQTACPHLTDSLLFTRDLSVNSKPFPTVPQPLCIFAPYKMPRHRQLGDMNDKAYCLSYWSSTCICTGLHVFHDCVVQMGKCLFKAVKLEVLLANMRQSLNQSKIRLLISKNQYLTISQFFHPQCDDGLKRLSVIFSDIFKHLL